MKVGWHLYGKVRLLCLSIHQVDDLFMAALEPLIQVLHAAKPCKTCNTTYNVCSELEHLPASPMPGQVLQSNSHNASVKASNEAQGEQKLEQNSFQLTATLRQPCMVSTVNSCQLHTGPSNGPVSFSCGWEVPPKLLLKS